MHSTAAFKRKSYLFKLYLLSKKRVIFCSLKVITDIAPRLVAAVPRKRINKCTVYEALMTRQWISNIQGALTVGIIAELLHLWDVLLTVQLQPGISNNHFWRLAAQGKYSAKAAYESFFLGAARLAPYQKIWKTWAPAKCRFFL
jgi:hypothetical protein